MFNFNTVGAVCGVALSATVAYGFVLSPSSAGASEIGTFGPYGVAIKNPVKYAAPPQDTVIECKPVARAGHFAGPLPAVMLIHGGAWDGGNNSVSSSYTGYSSSWCQLWASWGFDAFSVGYRLTRVKPWPAQIVDVQASIRWVRAHALALNVNPGLIVVNGDSAGGQLAMIAGYSDKAIAGDISGTNASMSSRPELIVSQFGPWTFGPGGAGAPSARAEDYATQLLIDLADRRTTDQPPKTLFVQGTRDTTVNQCTQSEPAFRFLTSNGHPASYLAYNGAHEFTQMNTSTWGQVVGAIETSTVSFAYDRAHVAGILPASEKGPQTRYADASLPRGCP